MYQKIQTKTKITNKSNPKQTMTRKRNNQHNKVRYSNPKIQRYYNQ
jgi:hypothetical protein